MGRARGLAPGTRESLFYLHPGVSRCSSRSGQNEGVQPWTLACD